MKFGIIVGCCVLVTLMVFAGGAKARRIPIHIYNTGQHYYYYTAETEAPRYDANTVPTSVTARSTEAKFEPYQKYVACVARTFLFEDCTLCFCTDIPSVALCWDYKGEKCTRTQKLVEQQKSATNNDPNGVW